MKEFIFDLQRFTTINKSNSNTLLSGGAGNDFIENQRSLNVTITGGAGDDSLQNVLYSNNVTIDGGEGNDYILNSASDSVSINAGDGDDTISNAGDNNTIDAGAGSDSIENWDSKVTISGGDGADSVRNIRGSNTSINGDAGNDCIFNGDYRNGDWNSGGNNVTINGGTGNDSIFNGRPDESLNGTNTSIYGNSGDDYIYNRGASVTVDGGADNDTIDNEYGENVLINAGAGNDSIFNTGDSVTIDGGTGNDTIRNNIHDTPSGGEQVSLNGGAGDDYINNDGNNSTLIGGTGNDTIENWGQNISLSGGEGNDYIINNDYYGTSGANSTIEAGAGNDSIYNYGNNVVFTYANGDGNDIIYGFNATSTLQIGGGSGTYSSQVSGNNIIITVGEGKITLSGAAGLSAINISGIYYNPLLIMLSEENDNYTNTLNGVIIQAQGGNDSIFNTGDFVTIDGGTGNDTIRNNIHDTPSGGEQVSLNGGAGDDYINNDGNNSTLIGGTGNDIIENWGQNISLSGGEGNDYIINNDYYGTSGANSTIEAGAGNDSIYNYGNNVVFTYANGDGNDIIYGFNATSTLQLGGGSGTYSSQVSGSNIIITVGEGKITLSGAANLSAVNISGVYNNPLLITGTEGADTINNSLEGATINALDGDDNISNYGSKVSISGGAGADYVWNSRGSYATITGGAGNDSILNTGSSVTITGGDGADTIWNNCEGSSVSIAGGAGNDTISNWGSSVTIAGNVGNDTISNNYNISGGYSNNDIDGSNVLFKYSSGDGNDIIYGFNATSTLQIGGGTGTYSSQVSGSDIIVTVGDGKITLSGAATLATVNIAGKENAKNTWNLSGTTATYGTAITITGVKSLSGISLSGKVVTIAASSLNASKVTISDGYTLALADDAPTTSSKKAWSLSGTTASYNQTTAEGYTLASDNKSISYTAAADKTLITVSGVKSLKGISLSGKVVTIAAASLNQEKVTVSDGYTLALADDAPTTSSKKAWSLSGTTAGYNQTTAEGYTLASDNKSISYTAAADKTLITVSGVKSLKGISLKDKVVTIAAASLNQEKVTVSDGYTLALADDAPTTLSKKAWSFSKTTATYNQTTSEGYTLASDNKSISYTAAATKTLATVSGVKSLKGISLKDKVVTVAASSLNQGKVTVSDGYTLALADDAPTTLSKKAWSFSKTTATYKQTSTEGYTLASDNKSISYTAAATKTLATISGVKSLKGISLKDKVVTVAASSLNQGKVTISDGYTLALAKNVTKTSSKKAWSLNKTTATYKQTSTEGYTLASDNKSISYTAAADKTLITVSGVKSLKGISLSGKVVTVAASSLNQGKVTISDGYNLKLASDVTKTSTKKAWSLSKTTATYKQTTSAGYSLAKNAESISYTKKATKTLATLKGLKSGLKVSNGKISGVSISGNKITLSKAALSTSDVTVSKGYTLALAKDTKSSTKKAWSLSKTTATYKKTKTASYTLSSNARTVSYNEKVIDTLATVNGVNSTKGLTISGETIKLATTSLSKKVSVSSDDYGFEFASDYKKAKITGSSSDETITSAGQKITIESGAGNDYIVSKGKSSTINAGAGNDTIVNSGANVTIRGGKGNDSLKGGKGKDIYIYAPGDGKDIITNYAEEDRISIKSGAVDVSTSGKNITFKVGTGKITLQKAKGKTVTYIVDDEEFIYSEGDIKYNAEGTGATLKATYSKDNFEPSNYSDYSALVTIDGAEVKHALKITGNKQANKITGTSNDDSIYGGTGSDTILGGAGNDELYGEKGNDSLIGGKGDDSLWGGKGSDILTGGAGNDIFCYNSGDGNDTITDYSPGVDKVMILSFVNVGNPETDNSGDVTFKVGSGQILFQNGANKYIELVDKANNILKKYNPR